MGEIMVYEQKQALSSFDIVVLVLSIFAVILISAPIIYSSTGLQKQKKADNESMKLGQILQNDLNSYITARSQQRRQIASATESKRGQFEGVIGEDPWGNPYFYKTQRDIYGKPQYLIIWSKGANLKQDTEDAALKLVGDKFELKGDDIGHIISLL